MSIIVTIPTYLAGAYTHNRGCYNGVPQRRSIPHQARRIRGRRTLPQARLAPAGAHRTIYVSGTACVRPSDGTWPGVTENSDGTRTFDIRQQTAAVLDNVDGIIKGATNGKGGVQNLIDAVVYLTDIPTHYAGMNEEWNKVFATRASAPARATIGVKELPDSRMIVEVKGVAVVEL